MAFIPNFVPYTLSMRLLLATHSIIGIVVTVALVSISIAVCFYLLSLKDKEKGDGKDDSETPDQ